MGPSDNKHPQFFKVFQPQQSSENLKLPPAFEEKIPAKIPSRVFLKNRNSSKSWLVEVGRIDGRLYFKGGWSKFVLENSLSFGDFMVFKYNGQRIFDVLILGRHGCVKEFVGAEGTEELANKEEDEDGDEDDDEDEEMRYTMSRNISSKKNLSGHITNSDEDEDEDFKPTQKYRKL
ncbi:B3 domain-containing protein At4g34400-like [Chenopodium quinoa]|uniref:B3 domain-containing protein At4g34400-like n=1 Tax=Chenopodium quinoa TaxID=63459 RepID=UPI000B76DB23|nr:B3 domain-containing protein At4g34400-like [Chenopodium quinoa]